MASTASTPPVEAPIATMRPLSGVAVAAPRRGPRWRRSRADPRQRCHADLCGQVVERIGMFCARLGDAIDRADFHGGYRRRGAALRERGHRRTGSGLSRITFSRNSMPFIFGISTSSVITSGLSALIASRACNGSAAWPTT